MDVAGLQGRITPARCAFIISHDSTYFARNRTIIRNKSLLPLTSSQSLLPFDAHFNHANYSKYKEYNNAASSCLEIGLPDRACSTLLRRLPSIVFSHPRSSHGTANSTIWYMGIAHNIGRNPSSRTYVKIKCTRYH